MVSRRGRERLGDDHGRLSPSKRQKIDNWVVTGSWGDSDPKSTPTQGTLSNQQQGTSSKGYASSKGSS